MSARNHNNPSQASSRSSSGARRSGSEEAALDPVIKRAGLLIQKHDYAGAANLLSAAGRDSQFRNMLGVCLMRMGKVDQAVDVYRSFVLVPGTVLERSDVSNASKRNYATALLLKGFPSGALSVLTEIRDPNHPMAERLYLAIRQWERTLTWFRWLDWKLNRVEPAKCRIPLAFEPGEFDFEVQTQPPIGPEKSRKAYWKLAA
ncbi:tetratricopeptide repeat protein [Neorhodopirellula pilleata]|uniref:Tetratricopeptide repeat protein n=1 Tax=Neorhodopirellula pilleata TaxID=2714738 RepID=A0A5C6ASF4_9BACT|nr:tetratricopeptide repeat protein [Neorhodopirellula pilleata]TWU01912.1 hypothetical protein Pla100_16480 [Neorhodopirellula pilleata]